MMAAIWSFLVSRNTAIVLLIAVCIVITIGAALPNPDLMPRQDSERLKGRSPALFWLGENFNSMKVGKSPVFGVVGVLLILSTALCSMDRLIKQFRARKDSSEETLPENRGAAVHLQDDGDHVRKLLDLLRGDRWRVTTGEGSGGTIISARKGDIGFLGSIFFHAVLITLIAGLVIYHFTAFYATLVITEGQGLRLTRESLTSIERSPVSGTAIPDVVLTLKRFSEEYHDDVTAIDHTAEISLVDMKSGRAEELVVKVNRPFSYAGTDFILHRKGESPRFILHKGSAPVFDSYVNLKLGDYSADSVGIPSETMEIEVRFFPDMARNPDGGVYSKGRRPLNPHFGLEVTREGDRLFRGLVKQGEAAVFGEYRLVVEDLRHWIALSLVREKGIGFFFASSMAGLAGALLRVLDPERRIAAVFAPAEGGQSLTLYHSSKHFDGLLKERLDEIIQQLREGKAEA